MAARLFIRRRDGRVEVRLNEAGRTLVREAVVHVVAAERDPTNEWSRTLNSPIDPSRDDDDPVLSLSRQNDITTNAELALVTVDEQYLNDEEAWAWLVTLQVALRSLAVQHGLWSEDQLDTAPAEVVDETRTIQQLLFELAACF